MSLMASQLTSYSGSLVGTPITEMKINYSKLSIVLGTIERLLRRLREIGRLADRPWS